MRLVYYLFIMILFGLSAFAYAQLPYEFTQLASINDGGRANDVVEAADGTIFLSNGSDGLRAYTYNGTSFINTAHIDDGDSALGIAVVGDSLVFLADGGGGLRAYIYDGTSFTPTAHIDDGGSAEAVAVASDGTIFLANHVDGLRAYTYNGDSFTNTAHVNDGGQGNELALASDGTVFLANGDDGVRAYGYDGTTFTNTAHIYESDYIAWEVAVSTAGTIFAVDRYLLRVYNYQDSSYIEVTNTNPHTWVQDMVVTTDSTIFVAGRSSVINIGKLLAYTYNGTSLVQTAHLDSAIDAYGIAVASDGAILLANKIAGLFAYSYDLVTGIDNSSPVPDNYMLKQNYPNPFNPATNIDFTLAQSGFVTLKVYNVLGEEVVTLLEVHKPAGRHVVNFDASRLVSGIYYYTLTTDDFRQSRKMVLLR